MRNMNRIHIRHLDNKRSRSIYTLLIVMVLLVSCTPKPLVQHIAHIQANNMQVSSAKEDDQIDSVIAPYRQEVSQEMDVVIGTVASTMYKEKMNGSLCNWVADAMYEEAKKIFPTNVDFAIQNYGGLRVAEVGQGKITKGKVFELMPFDNMLVLVKMRKKDVENLCQRIAEYGGWPISKQLRITVQDSLAKEIFIHGAPLSESTTYYVAMPDYIANGGDTCPFMVGLEQSNSGYFIREVLIQHIESLTSQNQMVQADLTARLIN